jgi:hypothetical protein
MDVGEAAQRALYHMPNCPKPGERYRHYKGMEVEVLQISLNEANMEPLVTYRDLPSGNVWTRSVQSFNECMYNGDSKDPKYIKRFVYIPNTPACVVAR